MTFAAPSDATGDLLSSGDLLPLGDLLPRGEAMFLRSFRSRSRLKMSWIPSTHRQQQGGIRGSS